MKPSWILEQSLSWHTQTTFSGNKKPDTVHWLHKKIFTELDEAMMQAEAIWTFKVLMQAEAVAEIQTS